MENVLNAFENKQINTTEARTTLGGARFYAARCRKWRGKGKVVDIRAKTIAAVRARCKQDYNGKLVSGFRLVRVGGTFS